MPLLLRQHRHENKRLSNALMPYSHIKFRVKAAFRALKPVKRRGTA
jgi:hypothetical protein